MADENNQIDYERARKLKPWVIILSIALPIAVAALFGIKIDGVDLTFLPPVYAGINGLTAIVLVLAVVAIKGGKRKRHEALMKFAIVLSCMFLLMYVAYHITSDTTFYGDANFDGFVSVAEAQSVGTSQWIYYGILVSHILLSIAIIPMVLITYVRGITNDFARHRKIAKRTFPIWLYVAVSGVVVYFMIAPYYG